MALFAKHKSGESYFQMDFYTVIFLIPSTGNRVVLNGVQAEVEMQEGVYYEHKNPFGTTDHIMPIKSPHLDIVLTMNHNDKFQLEEIKEQLFSEEVYLSFKDIHPCLIRGFVKGMTMDQHKATVRFKGHTIDKTYNDFITEATDQLNAYQYYLESPEPDEPEEVINEIMNQLDKEKKGKVIKRKLTF